MKPFVKVINLNVPELTRIGDQLERIANLMEIMSIEDDYTDFQPSTTAEFIEFDEEAEILDFHLKKRGIRMEDE
jgi:hypothetical protein